MSIKLRTLSSRTGSGSEMQQNDSLTAKTPNSLRFSKACAVPCFIVLVRALLRLYFIVPVLYCAGAILRLYFIVLVLYCLLA